MGKFNQVIGDIYKKFNPDAANALIIARNIKRERGGRKIIICACDGFAARLDTQLAKLGCDGAAYFIDIEKHDDKLNGKDIREPESLMYENTKDIYLAVTASPHTHRILGKLLELGFKTEQLHIFCNENIPGGSRLLDVYDVNLGFTREDDIPGFTIFDSGVDSTKPVETIVTLGGSTTDATFANVMSWSEFLQHMLVERGINAVIYCGGIAAANSTQELIKCIRDVIPLEPRGVLVYSGINDIKMNESDTPFVLDYQWELAEKCIENGLIVNNKAYRNVGSNSKLTLNKASKGLPNKKSRSRYWTDNIRMVHAVCTEFGILFHAFLQPNAYVGSGGEVSFHRELFGGRQAAGYKAITEEMINDIKDIDYITDLTSIMNGKMQWYMDDCHVLEPGNRIIAEAILPKAVEMCRS